MSVPRIGSDFRRKSSFGLNGGVKRKLPLKKLLSVEDVASRWQCSWATIRRLVDEEDLPALRLRSTGGAHLLRFDPVELEKWRRKKFLARVSDDED